MTTIHPDVYLLHDSIRELDDEGLTYLVDALCKLSLESMETAYNNREPSLFAVAKLLETGLVNVHRINVIWKPLTLHLLEVSRHPHQKMREWGAESVTSLVKAVLTSERSCAKDSLEKRIYLAPLHELSHSLHSDIRQKQLDTCLQMLQSSGDALGDGWPQIIEIVMAISTNQTENMIRLAFQCLQLIVGDMLANVPYSSIIQVIDATAKFGCQCQELNVSLTAIGSIWNIADFLFQNQESLRASLNTSDEKAASTKPVYQQLPAFECLWMSLFVRLGELCTDPRPAVRKSASQTLFAALNTHGSVLEVDTWQLVLYRVLFPLLERVRTQAVAASTDKITDVPKSMGMTGGRKSSY